MTRSRTGPGRPQFSADLLTELFRNPLDPGYADAAARRARDGAVAGWPRRLIAAASVLTLVALGVLLAVAYRQTVAQEPVRSRARTTLVEQVQRRQVDTDRLQVQADRLRAEVSDLRERQLDGPAAARIRMLEAVAGFGRVRGSGARITLGDGRTPIDPVTGRRQTDGRVQDSDLQLAANALWSAGAEAIAVNGQRLTATSTIRQAGEAILVDFRPVTTPYEITAIGPDDLAKTFGASYAGRFFRQLGARFGVSFAVSAVDRLTLPAATELTLRFAVPATPPPAGSVASSSPGSAGPASEGGR